MKKYKIAVAGTGYVGLSIATLLSQHHHVTAVDIVPEKVEMINNRKPPIQDDYIEKYLAEKDLDLTATLDAKDAYSDGTLDIIKKYENQYNMRWISEKDNRMSRNIVLPCISTVNPANRLRLTGLVIRQQLLILTLVKS